MLEIKNITKEYKTEDFVQKALDDVSINFRKNEFVSILGQSGSGKSTLLNIVGGLDHYTKGDLIINGISTKKYKDSDWDSYSNYRIGFIFQNYNLIGHQTVLANVELALTLSGVSKSEKKRRAKEALKKVGLEDHINKKPNQLSGGQMQRVAIARALVNNPEIILADEPTGALDSETSIQIMNLLKEIAKDKLVIMVTHNPEIAEKYSTRIIRLKDGKITDDSNPYNQEESEKVEDNANKLKTSMGLFTALSLSLNNLLTKKGRTFLTAIAGSIGIIGIAIILALSNGVNTYISSVEKDTLSNQPIAIEKETMDLDGLMSLSAEDLKNTDVKLEENTISIKDDISSISANSVSSFMKENNLKLFKKYLDEEDTRIKENASTIQYTYNTELNIYTKYNDKIVKVNPVAEEQKNQFTNQTQPSTSPLQNIFKELINNNDIIDNQYEVISGKMPSNYDEIILIADKDGILPLSTMYTLCIEDRNELVETLKKSSSEENKEKKEKLYSYDDLIGRSYKIILNSDFYVKENDKWIDKSNDIDYLNKLYENGYELKIVGIAKARNENQQSGFVGYTEDLIKFVGEKNNEKQIAKEQFANKNKNVLTGIDFDKLNTSYEKNLVKLGMIEFDNPQTISIYPKGFDEKPKIKDAIKEYNEKVEKNDKIVYSDMMEVLVSQLTNIVNIISAVLIAIVAVSLVVSGIMISIITYISVLERTKEIGILRAIGASKKDIKRVFRAETIIEGFISGILGIGVAELLCMAANVIIKGITQIENVAKLPVDGACILIAISVILTVIAGAIPSGMASRRDPVESLRSE